MTTLYDDIGPPLVAAFVTDPYFSLLRTAAPNYYITTLDPPDVTADGTRAVAIIPAGMMRDAVTLPAIVVWDAPFYALADAAEDVSQGGVVSNGTLSFIITQAPITWIGYLIAPAKEYTGALS
jgi:hypothetical protein